MATYFVCSAAAGTNTGASWVNAHVSIPGCMTAQALVGGDIIYVHNTHNYVAGAAITWTLPETGNGLVKVICVDGGDAAFTALGAGMGSTIGSQTSGAIENTNGNFAFGIGLPADAACALLVHGIAIQAGAGGNSAAADINLSITGAGWLKFQQCAFYTNSTNAGAVMTIGVTSSDAGRSIEFLHCTFRFASTSQLIATNGGRIKFIGCSVHASGSTPTTLFQPIATAKGEVECYGCDWTKTTNLLDQSNTGTFRFFAANCAIATPITGTHPGVGGRTSEFHACAAADAGNGANMLAYYKEDAWGIVQDDQVVYLTSNPSQGTQDDGTATSYSFYMNTTAAVGVHAALYTPWIYKKVTSTGSKTISMKVADTEGALLKNTELWMEVQYVGGAQLADTPQSQHELTALLQGATIYQDYVTGGSNLTDTGEAWTAITETGTYTLSKTVTIDEQGYVRCRVGLGKDTTNPVYVDGSVTIA